MDAERFRAAGGRYWPAADIHERANGRLAVKVVVAMPIELTAEQQIDLARQFAIRISTLRLGGVLPITWALHEGYGVNPHVHFAVSERINDGYSRSESTWFKRAATGAKPIEAGGARKTRELAQDWVAILREDWAQMANEALERAGSESRIDPRSNAERGIDDVPDEHIGYGKGRARRQQSNRRRRDLNEAVRRLRAERERILNGSTIDLSEVGQVQPELTHDDRPDHQRIARLSGHEREHRTADSDDRIEAGFHSGPDDGADAPGDRTDAAASDERIDPVLMRLPAARRPPEKTACSTCPSAMWIAGERDVKAYCHVMKLVSWSNEMQEDLTACDGREASLVAMASRE